MKFLTLFAAGAMAATPVLRRAEPVKRDVATVESAISSIQDATTALTDAVNNFSPEGVADLQSAATAAISAITDATSAVDAIPELTQTEALGLPGPVQELAGVVDTAAQAAIDQKQTFVDAGIGSIVYDQLLQIQTAAQDFSTTLISKVPEGLRGIANNLAQPIQDSLQRAVDEYADQAGGGGGSSSAEPTATPTGGETTAAPTSEPTAPAPTGGSSSYPTATSDYPPIATGAAHANAAGFGAAAVAALAVVAAI